MPRQARRKSRSGCYHILLKGNAGCALFLTNADRNRFLELLLEEKRACGCKIFAFCLLDNSVHLLLKEQNSTISTFMHRLNTAYAAYFKGIYHKSGHIFQGRFKSAPIENKTNLLATMRFIHRLPEEKGFVRRSEDYWWCSYLIYMTGEHRHVEVIDMHSFYVLMGWERDMDVMDLYETKNAEDMLYAQNGNIVLPKEQLTLIWLDILKRQKDMSKAINEFYQRSYLSVREVAKITGYSKSKIHRNLH